MLQVVGSPAQDDTMPLVGSAMALVGASVHDVPEVVGSPTQDDTMAPISSSDGDALDFLSSDGDALEFLATRAYLLGHLPDPTIKAATSGDLLFVRCVFNRDVSLFSHLCTELER